MILVSCRICLCPIHWSQMFSREWRCSRSSADRPCPNYIWVINSFIAYYGMSYIRGLTVVLEMFPRQPRQLWSSHRWDTCHVTPLLKKWFVITVHAPGPDSWGRISMMTSSNGNIFRVIGPLCGEFTGPWWIPSTKASDAELWCFLWSASE